MKLSHTVLLSNVSTRLERSSGTAPTLVGVILSSGGVTDKADLSKVKVMRMAANKGVVEEINVQAILDGKGLGSDVTLSEGDVVIIPVGQPNLVYVTGNVKRQGSYKLVPGERLTALSSRAFILRIRRPRSP